MPKTDTGGNNNNNNKGEFRSLVFYTQALFSAGILVFCCYQISRDSDGCSNSLLSWYCSVIGVIVTNWVKTRRENPPPESSDKQLK